MLRKTGHNPDAGCDKNRIYLLDTIRYHDPLCCHLLRIQPGLVAGIVQPLSMSHYCDVTFLLKQSSNLPGWVVETGLVDPLDHLGRQYGGQLVGDPAGQLAPRV